MSSWILTSITELLHHKLQNLMETWCIVGVECRGTLLSSLENYIIPINIYRHIAAAYCIHTTGTINGCHNTHVGMAI